MLWLVDHTTLVDHILQQRQLFSQTVNIAVYTPHWYLFITEPCRFIFTTFVVSTTFFALFAVVIVALFVFFSCIFLCFVSFLYRAFTFHTNKHSVRKRLKDFEGKTHKQNDQSIVKYRKIYFGPTHRQFLRIQIKPQKWQNFRS